MDKDKKLLFEALENPEVLERSVSRRGALGLTGKFGAGVALATMPVMMAALTRRAFAQGTLPNEIVNPLNFALVLEYLEADFYTMGLESGVIPAEDRTIFEQLTKHETAHVAFLSTVLGSQAAIRPTWDFTAGGTFDPFNDYPTFTLLSQGFEDTGVRAYKGQAGNVASNDDILTAALRIHSVEARHASEIRRLRGEKGWITLANGPAPLAAVYAGEDNTTHLGIDVSGYQGAEAATEAFDEPLGIREVLAIAGLFGTGA